VAVEPPVGTVVATAAVAPEVGTEVAALAEGVTAEVAHLALVGAAASAMGSL